MTREEKDLTVKQMARLGAAARWAGMTPSERIAATEKMRVARRQKAKEARESGEEK